MLDKCGISSVDQKAYRGLIGGSRPGVPPTERGVRSRLNIKAFPMPHSAPGTSDEKLIEAETEILALRSQSAALRAAGDRSAVARRSGWENVLPHRGMFPGRRALPHQVCP